MHGRFAPRQGRIRKLGRPRSGLRGPSYYAQKTPLALARMIVRLEHVVGRLNAECRGETWSDPERVRATNMVGIRKLQMSDQEKRLAALDEVLDEVAMERLSPKTPGLRILIADRVASKLVDEGLGFVWEYLYRQPYKSRWRKVDDWLGRCDADGAVGISEYVRWSKSRLVWKFGRLTKERDELLAVRRTAIADDPEAAGWEPIKRR